MPNTILGHRLQSVENKVDKLENDFKNLSDKSIKHDENILSINKKINYIDDKKASHHDIKNQKNVTGLILDQYKNLDDHDKQQDMQISENKNDIIIIKKTLKDTADIVNKLANQINNMTPAKTIGYIIGGMTAVVGLIVSVFVMLNKLMIL